MRVLLSVGSTVKIGENYYKVSVGLEDDAPGTLADTDQEDVMDHYDELEAVLHEVLAEKLSNVISISEGVVSKYKRKRSRR